MSRVSIENCDADELDFTFKCPKQWEKLELTDTTGTRFCQHCSRHVYYCASIDQAKYHAGEGHCVAVDLRVKRRPNDLIVGDMLMGQLVGYDFEAYIDGVPIDDDIGNNRKRWWQFWK